jgi:hypothetical protein
MRFFAVAILLVMSSVYADSVRLLNDSPYPLTAIVQAANGDELGQVLFQPGEQADWTNEHPTQLNIPYNSSTSLSPYIVIWKCVYEGVYSICMGVSPGSQVTANNCAGMHYCQPKPKKQQEQASTSCIESFLKKLK